MEYLAHILVIFCLFSVLSVSLDLLAGQTGLLSLSHAAFFAVGAYTAALATLRAGAPFLVGVVAAMAVAAAVSLLVSLSSLRLHEDYFVITTFGFQMIVYNVLQNWLDVTRGPLGIAGIPQPVFFGWTIRSPWEFLALAAPFALLAYAAVLLITTSPFGRVLRAIREDEVFAQSLGKNTFSFKVKAFAVSAALAGAAGAFYAHYATYIDPSSFTLMESVLILAMVVTGGAGSRYGPLVGAAVLVALPEALRFVGLPAALAANLRQLFYGASLAIMMVARPRGLVGRYGFQK